MVYDLYFEEKMKESGCYISDEANAIVQLFAADESNDPREEETKKLYATLSKNETIEYCLRHSHSVEEVAMVAGVSDEH